MDFNFEAIQKNSYGYLDSDTVRVGKQTLGMPVAIVDQFQKYSRPTRIVNRASHSAAEVVFLGIAYDPRSKALKLFEASPSEGYATAVHPISGNATVPIPRVLWRKGLERGVYKLVPGHDNIYQFQGE